MNALFASAVLFLTVVLAVSFGILASYSFVNGILYAFGHHSRPKQAVQPVLLAQSAQAGGD
ncbi:MAG TPA: hypothetical protein VFI95_11005 [Terriglobales bacterium]|nr:hypothetical protein [Terriglobales bacterium]